MQQVKKKQRKCVHCTATYWRVEPPDYPWPGQCPRCVEQSEATEISRRMQEILDDEIRMPWERKRKRS